MKAGGAQFVRVEVVRAATTVDMTAVDDMHSRDGRAGTGEIHQSLNSKKPPVSSAKTTTEGYQNHNQQEVDPS